MGIKFDNLVNAAKGLANQVDVDAIKDAVAEAGAAIADKAEDIRDTAVKTKDGLPDKSKKLAVNIQ